MLVKPIPLLRVVICFYIERESNSLSVALPAGHCRVLCDELVSTALKHCTGKRKKMSGLKAVEGRCVLGRVKKARDARRNPLQYKYFCKL
jgi:hypothetical protein